MARKDYREQNQRFMDEISKAEGVLELGNGVYYKVLATGKGKTPSFFNSVVTCHYRGRRADDDGRGGRADRRRRQPGERNGALRRGRPGQRDLERGGHGAIRHGRAER